MTYCINPQISTIIGKSLMITGAARSGTTLMGKLIYSLSNVELLYEPPLLVSLIPHVQSLSKNVWCLLFETYLFEDFLIDTIAGRRININRHDNSSIFNAKSEREVEERLARSIRKQEAFGVALTRKIAFKLPGVLPFMGTIGGYYPDMKILIMLRRPGTVIVSLLRHGWFSDLSLSELVRVWPCRSDGVRQVPYWVPDKTVDGWLGASEIERCGMYYEFMYETLSSLTRYIVVDYDHLVADPDGVFGKIVQRLGLEYGEKTASIVQSIRYQETSSQFDLGQLPEKLRARVCEIYEFGRNLSGKA